MATTKPTAPDPAAPDPRWPVWFAAADHPALDAALRACYAELDEAIVARSPTCWQSGRCCHFVRYGHRLYVTALEVAWFLARVRDGASHAEPGHTHTQADPTPAGSPGAGRSPATRPALEQYTPAAASPGACPYQVGHRCTTHAIRPLGCRIFFCQQGTQQWQHELYERYLQRLRGLHDTHGIPYRYLEWLAGLDEAAGFTPGAAATHPVSG